MSNIRLVILGSTGSIGRSCLEIVRAHRDRVEVVALAAAQNVDLLAKQAVEFTPRYVGVADESGLERLRGLLPARCAEHVTAGSRAAVDLAQLEDAEVLLNAVVGAAGLEPSLAAVTKGRRLLLANKESLVIGGELLMKAVQSHGGILLPVDSEHNAILRCLQYRDRADIREICLTASGGPFLKQGADEAGEQVNVERVLNHPTWKMGKRVTVDSATLLNKGFEVIEAQWLFGFDLESIRILIHPQSIVHGLVRYADGSLMAHMSVPDMKIPLSYALLGTVPPAGLWDPLDLSTVGALEFSEPDLDRFPCLGLALETARAGGTAPAVLNAADEVAVSEFLASRLEFSRLPELLRTVLESHRVVDHPTLEQVKQADIWARRCATEQIEKIRLNSPTRNT